MGRSELLVGKGHPPIQYHAFSDNSTTTKIYVVVTESDGGTDVAAFSNQRAANKYEREGKQQVLADNDEYDSIEDAEDADYFSNIGYYVSQHIVQIFDQ